MADSNPPIQTDASSSGPNYGVQPPLANPPIVGEPKNEPPFTNPAPPPSGAGTMTVRSPDQLANVATTEVNSEIEGQVSPLQAQFDTTNAQEERTRQAIESMFGTIQPYVAGEANQVAASYGEAEGMQQNIFSAAMQRLNQLKQSKAQEAQALAQEMGGPVAMSDFTAGMDSSLMQGSNLFAGQMLHTLGYAQAGEQQARDFAGKVFPLIHTEEQAKARNYFEDKKKELQDQITQLRGSASSKIEARKNELLAQERTFQLQKTQESLDALKANRDWKATLRTLKNDDARLGLAKQQAALQSKSTNASIALQRQRLTQQDRQFQAQMGLTKQQMTERKVQLAQSSKLAQAHLAAAQNATYAQWLDAAVNPQPGKTVTMTQTVPSDYQTAMKDPQHSYKGSDGKYYHIIQTKYTPTTAAITNPGALVDYLVAHQVPKKIAVNMVKHRLRIPNWVYGQGDPNSPTGDQGRNKPGGIVRPG